MLEALRAGPLDFPGLFERSHHRREDPVFLGDAVLLWHLERLEAEGFIAKEACWRLAARGEQVLSGQLDAWSRPRRARWLGGYEARDGRLRWDPAAGALVLGRRAT